MYDSLLLTDDLFSSLYWLLNPNGEQLLNSNLGVIITVFTNLSYAGVTYSFEGLTLVFVMQPHKNCYSDCR